MVDDRKVINIYSTLVRYFIYNILFNPQNYSKIENVLYPSYTDENIDGSATPHSLYPVFLCVHYYKKRYIALII